jgi:hypothetical protein
MGVFNWGRAGDAKLLSASVHKGGRCAERPSKERTLPNSIVTLFPTADRLLAASDIEIEEAEAEASYQAAESLVDYLK